ncbi:MAG: enolase C-terminal domain-like protein, partial [Paracoccaceae bacterium]
GRTIFAAIVPRFLDPSKKYLSEQRHLYLGAKMCIEDTWESDISTAALAYLGAATDPRQVLDVCDLSGYVVPHVAPDGPLCKNGRLAPPDAPGLGISPDPDILGAPDLVLEYII